MLDLTAGQDAPEEAPNLSDFEQEDDRKSAGDENPDEFDQQEPTQEINNLYASRVHKESHSATALCEAFEPIAKMQFRCFETSARITTLRNAYGILFCGRS